MSVDQYQRTVNSLDKEIAELERKKAAADKKAADEAKKAAGVSISKNASASTIKSKMNGIGKILPTMQIGIALHISMCRKLATSSPPRSSNIGHSEIIKTINSDGIPPNASIIA